jgi:hypothetical protein
MGTILLLAGLAMATAPADPERDYLLWVVSEPSDGISLVRFGPAGARLEREIEPARAR